jgi:hypothetical protein
MTSTAVSQLPRHLPATVYWTPDCEMTKAALEDRVSDVPSVLDVVVAVVLYVRLMRTRS